MVLQQLMLLILMVEEVLPFLVVVEVAHQFLVALVVLQLLMILILVEEVVLPFLAVVEEDLLFLVV